MKRIARSLRRNFLAGLLFTVPFGLTVFILFKLGKWIIGLVSAAPAKVLIKPLSELHPLLFQFITFTIGLLGAILIVLIVGTITRNYIGKKLFDIGEGLISKIPLARTIYTATKQIIGTLFLGTGFKGISRVVMFEYPRKGVYSIGLVTGIPQYTQSGKRLLGIFLPTALNPTGGYYLMIPEDEVKELPISVEEASKIIISGGLASNQIETAELSKEDDKAV
jgi:uncharacterized membrane protein